ncbi:hypothetical protein QBC33DRAFT_569219 [Phialemonium atrogriseum]|uniref:Uncharacterized protein n=1 Tax=Phialemonium atrogriseum TaxID=1093897 RepID=A0AAJ0C1H8_9PEZI|nr:uncharacterized protein QBC33DRAFT_569219 [Phialemonium atrogriseum]KAK1768181.1 hypothetical protein QBC33DRAFT_569219 [Phialemonium atrogriseum]
MALDLHIARSLCLVFLQPAGSELARLAYRKLYGRDVCPEVVGDMVVRDEYLGWVPDVKPYSHIDYYGVTFHHLVPSDDLDPDVLQITVIELEADTILYAIGEAYADEGLLFTVDLAEYVRKKVLAMPRCCQKRKGTQDRGRINNSVAKRDARA